MDTSTLTDLRACKQFNKVQFVPGKVFIVLVSSFCFFTASAQLIRSGSGANVAAIQSIVDQFRTDLGTLNSNVAGSFATGRREINWDGVPDASAAPNNLAANFFNVNSLRGAILSTPGTGFQVSANASNPTSTPVEFNNIDATYSSLFQPFSAQRLFTALGSNVTDVTFYFPGSTTPAAVKGFGSVFTDVDLANVTSIQFFDMSNNSLGTFPVPAMAGQETLSFLGVSYPTAVISRVRITSGNAALGSGVNETALIDLVVMDDFIYGEPVSPQVVVRSGAGPSQASIQAFVDQYRNDLGTLNANVTGSFGSGRREINWDGVPDAFAAPNNLPANFFNVNSPRGVIIATPGTGLQVSANASNPTSTPVEFNNLNPSYSTLFAPFSTQRLFTALSSNITDITFFVAGSNTTALVKGFGSVFTDVDLKGVTSIQYFDQNNASLGTYLVPFAAGNETFSFFGLSYAAPTILKVRITSGNAPMGVSETPTEDLVVMDDFIYGEPVSLVSLPINFTSTKASEKNNGIQVQWSIATESNIKEYQVEKSIDGRSFIKAGVIAASNNNGNMGTYNWYDVQPNNVVNYYRIKVITTTGEIKYSEVVRVNTSIKGKISVYPNPVSGNYFNLQLINKPKGDYMVRLSNNAGQTLYSKMINHDGGSATESIKLPILLAKGIYHLSIRNNNQPNELIKLVIVR
ncbi:MAG: motif putative anchor domain protein [Segetibacter sp.]|nr:motif putative anchor domain protein [Segetibacter sp.]